MVNWEETKLGVLFNVNVGGDLQKDCFSAKQDKKHQYPIYSNSLDNNGLYGFTSKARHPENSITITGRGSLGHAEYRDISFDAIVRLLVLTPKTDDVDCVFITYYINNRINFAIESTGVPQLTAPKILKTKVFIPTQKTEQTAIATILSKVDEAIEATRQSIKAAEKLKKALMQNLLTGKLKPDGTWRKDDEFYEDEKFGKYPQDWNFSRFKDYAVLQRGKDLTDNEVISGPYPVVKSNGVQIHHNQYFVEPPGVVTGRSGTIGKVFFIEEKFWSHNTSLYIKDFKGNNPKFIYFLIHRMDFRKYYAGTTVPTLNRNDIHRLKIAIPKTFEEQEEIANRIDEYDKLLKSKQSKIQTLQRLKKSLMQNLLTGKVRLDVEAINKIISEQ
jgi:type I restriction enzyme, S subunit